jgi:hypothetical protein
MTLVNAESQWAPKQDSSTSSAIYIILTRHTCSEIRCVMSRKVSGHHTFCICI